MHLFIRGGRSIPLQSALIIESLILVFSLCFIYCVSHLGANMNKNKRRILALISGILVCLVGISLLILGGWLAYEGGSGRLSPPTQTSMNAIDLLEKKKLTAWVSKIVFSIKDE